MDNENELFDFDYSTVEPSKDFVAAKAGLYGLTVDEIEVGERGTVEELDQVDDRLIAKIRHSFTSPDAVDKISEKGIVGSIFNRLWLHNTKSIGFLRAFVEGHGGDWGAFTAGIKAGKGSRPYADVIRELLEQFKGATGEARVALVTKHYKTGELLPNPRNEITKYIVSSAVNTQ